MPERTVRLHSHDRIFSLPPSVHIAESSRVHGNITLCLYRFHPLTLEASGYTG